MPFFALLIFIAMVVAIIDAITRRDDQIKHLPKVAWVFLIVLIPMLGSILWFTIGREWQAPRDAMSFGDPRRRANADGATPPRPPALSTEEQIAALEREMRIAELEAQVRAKRAEGDTNGASRD